jgi:hypothetical protein
MVHGHLTRMAVWKLRSGWTREAPTPVRMEAVRAWYREFGGLELVLAALDGNFSSAPPRQEWMLAGMVRENTEVYDEISF